MAETDSVNQSSINKAREIPVEVYIPEDVTIEFADTFTVQATSEEVIISFLQTQHPIVFTETDAENIKVIESLCLARIALTPTRLELFIKLLQDHAQSRKNSSANVFPQDDPGENT
jgi:hypothetical protein